MSSSTQAALPQHEPFRALYIHTHDVSRSLKPSADGELAHAIHQTLHFALDGHPDDYTPAAANSGAGSGCDPLATMPTSSAPNGSSSALAVNKGFAATGDAERPYISYYWDAHSGTLALPNPATITNPVADPCSSDHRSSYEITAKLFFLDEVDAGLVDEALTRLTRTTGIITIDTLVLSFPTLDLDSKTSTSTDAIGKVAEVWGHVSQNPQLFSLGLADISPSSLDALLGSLDPPVQPPSMPLFSPAIPLSSTTDAASSSTAEPEQASGDVASEDVSTEGTFWNMEYSLVSSARRPRLVSINVKQDPCAFDRQFSQYCAGMGIQLVAHSDRRDVLPQRTLPALMDEFEHKMPKKAPKALRPKWALKYTTLIRDRGVLADKGYIVYVAAE
ncbi:uncharacterized protein PAN0_010d4063 [Moesziomyces antarcticus]|uniref:Uncharacterized protein n=2 Tax=Pseudozyma antarctica TaxID=84753 RepID=A0A5C3FPS1_PSEA2|nr:uncharacterized protein PAN0_010d4063 [Moesziomyces antarcticus]GAK65841.1 conserved hypothetical protein [Moesziomyces antarcticus]SPO45471.1 uncharacterized protein PSANT_03157 [Moesziomyces antarcticus]